MTYKQLVQTLSLYGFDEIRFTRHTGETEICVKKGGYERKKAVPDDVVYKLSADVVEWHVERLINEVKHDSEHG